LQDEQKIAESVNAPGRHSLDSFQELHTLALGWCGALSTNEPATGYQQEEHR